MHNDHPPLIFMLEKGSGSLPTLMPDWDLIEARNLAIPVKYKTECGQPSDCIVALLMHCHHVDGLSLMLSRLICLKDRVKWFFTTDTDSKAEKIDKVCQDILTVAR